MNISEFQKVVFMDRDGVINVRRHDPEDDTKNYVLTWDDFEWIPGSIEAIGKLLKDDYMVIVVSNQAGINKGVADYVEVDQIFADMCRVITRSIDRPHAPIWYSFCPHTKDQGCECRKPKPGMITEKLVNLDLRSYMSWMIGDANSDIKAGWNGGIRKLIKLPSLEDPNAPMYFYGETARNFNMNTADGVLINSLPHAVDFIIEWDSKNA